VLVDFGAKSGIIRDLTKRGCDVVVVPQDATTEQIRRLSPDGVLLSNGPGDPKDVPHAVEMIRELLGTIPIFGICLGHQLFALACGADTGKLKFGHRGGNHPVKDLASGRCYITSQNHGYTVVEESVAGTELEVTHINNNDGTIEGLKHKKHAAFSVQYHPEAAPGPFDSSYLFDEFLDLIRKYKDEHPQQPRQAMMQAAWKAGAGDTAKGKGELLYAQK
jgi:carbamoyl-phosphate synthase small subunit